MLPGGSSGCDLASRLASAEPSLSILVVEGGPANKDNPQIIYPALSLSNLLPGSETARSYISKSSEKVAGRNIPVATGGAWVVGEVLISTSAELQPCIDALSKIGWTVMYLRPSATDFNDWGMGAWGSDQLIPLMKKVREIQARSPIGNDKLGRSRLSISTTTRSMPLLTGMRVRSIFLRVACSMTMVLWRIF